MALGKALVFAAPAAASCDEDSLETVSDGGDILIMQSGHVYQVDSGDTVDTQSWLSAEDVLICNGVMINKDENGEKASVTLLSLTHTMCRALRVALVGGKKGLLRE